MSNSYHSTYHVQKHKINVSELSPRPYRVNRGRAIKSERKDLSGNPRAVGIGVVLQFERMRCRATAVRNATINGHTARFLFNWSTWVFHGSVLLIFLASFSGNIRQALLFFHPFNTNEKKRIHKEQTSRFLETKVEDKQRNTSLLRKGMSVFTCKEIKSDPPPSHTHTQRDTSRGVSF